MSYRHFTITTLTTAALWLNITLSIVGLFYWKALELSADHMTSFWIGNVAAALNIAICLWLYFSADAEVRRFLISRGLSPLFCTPKEILKLLETPKHAYTYARKTIGKYQIGLSCAAGWTVTLWVLALSGPTPNAVSDFAPRAIPWLGAVAGLVLCIALTLSIYRLKALAANKWFFLEKHMPTQQDAPEGALQGAVLVRAPQKIPQWRDQQYQVMGISQLRGPHMPNQDELKNKIEWTFLPIDSEFEQVDSVR